jgi:hypothetical protein
VRGEKTSGLLLPRCRPRELPERETDPLRAAVDRRQVRISSNADTQTGRRGHRFRSGGRSVATLGFFGVSRPIERGQHRHCAPLRHFHSVESVLPTDDVSRNGASSRAPPADGGMLAFDPVDRLDLPGSIDALPANGGKSQFARLPGTRCRSRCVPDHAPDRPQTEPRIEHSDEGKETTARPEERRRTLDDLSHLPQGAARPRPARHGKPGVAALGFRLLCVVGSLLDPRVEPKLSDSSAPLFRSWSATSTDLGGQRHPASTVGILLLESPPAAEPRRVPAP